MRRRDFISLIGAAPAIWPLAAFAQDEQVRRLGILMNLPEGDPEGKRRIDALLGALGGLGWIDGRNLGVIHRWGVDHETIQKNAAELVALAPNVILANAPPSVEALRQVNHTVPVVFAVTSTLATFVRSTAVALAMAVRSSASS